MSSRRLKDYGRFVARVAAAGAMGGVLGAAGEYLLGVALGEGRLWAAPRYFYQLLLGGEALWLAFATPVLFAAAATLYYLWAARRGPVRLASPALLTLVVSLSTVAASRFLGTFDHRLLHAPRAEAFPFIAAITIGTAGAWVGLATVLYRGIKLIRRRPGKPGVSVVALRVWVLALWIPFVAADVWTLLRTRGATTHKPDVYFVVMDAFRADRLQAYGAERRLAPRLEALTAEGVVFREAFSTSSWTKPAVASLFASALPSVHRVRSRFVGMPPEALTLAECLKESGYCTIGISANPNITRPAGMADGFDLLDNTGGGSALEAAGPPVSAARLMTRYPVTPAFIGALWRPTRDGMDLNRRLAFWRRITGGGPRFFYIHYMETHNPNVPRPEYRTELQPYLDKVEKDRAREIMIGKYFFEKYVEDPTFVPPYNEDEVALANALYDADVRRMDVVMKDLLDNVIPPAGEEYEPILIVTADHGEEFLEHGRWMHGASLHREVAEIPLIFLVPGYDPAVVSGPVSLLDVGPTVVSLTGEPVPEAWEGKDLKPYLAGREPAPPRALLLEGIQDFHFRGMDPPYRSLELNALVTSEYYYLRDENAEREYLYERRRDPRQERDLAGDPEFSDPEGVLRDRRARLGRLRREAASRAFTPPPAYIPPQLEKSLRALGYVN